MSSSSRRGAHVARGALIGAVEAIPGISGGTMALVTGVYEVIIASAGHLVSGLRLLLTDRTRARAKLRQVRWDVLLPLLLGMAPALVASVLLLAPMIDRYPVQMRALLLGMVTAALLVPLSMVGGRWRAWEVAVALLGAGLAFLATGQVQVALEPSLPVVFVAAAVAVCALVLPGVSGAFLLLAFGMYGPTSDALRQLDFAYIAVFLLGAVTGLSLFVKALQWLLEYWRRLTLVVMTGLMIGALRALWPWQDEDNRLLAPDASLPLALALCLVGAVAVIAIVLMERAACVPATRDDPARSSDQPAAR